MSVDLQVEPAAHPEQDPEDLANRIIERVKLLLRERLHVPTSTYRVQLNRYFTFEQAREVVDYLAALGIGDLYVSPYFKARADSLHGYDIANHNELNPSIGTEEDYAALVEALHAHGMGHILDTVPNHMGIAEEGNLWWMDVLENGRASIYASHFDVDWNPINTRLTNKVLLPVLGDQYGRVLENAELCLNFSADEGRFWLSYYDHSFPIDPGSYAVVLEHRQEELVAALGPESEPALEYQSILTALGYIAPHSDSDRARSIERNREKEVIKRRLAALCAAEPLVRQHIEASLVVFNGTAGDARSFDLLDSLLERQPYRLSNWRVATEEINYRRFFDVNELAAIRVDEPAVFDATHRLVMRFLREGKLNGLRIDHIDGLRHPAGYLRMLQRAYFLEICRVAADELEGPDAAPLEEVLLARYDAEVAADPQGILARPLYVLVEKILGRGEKLSADWATHGTTGYEFTNAVNGLLVDGSNQRAFDEIYTSFTGERVKFADLVYESKKQIMRLSLSSEMNVLTNMLNNISERDRRHRDFTLNSLRHAIREVIAVFPVYRTYITPEQTEPDKRDQAIITTAVARARKRNPATDPTIFDFVGEVLLLKGYEDLPEEERSSRYDFVMKFQQVTGPVTAKGLEDTAFYNYNRLISLNEVGGEPGYFGISQEQFHREQLERQRNWPLSLLTTSTHDTKRSEDVRARISVLSEMPAEWRAAVRRWSRANRTHKRSVDGQFAPSANEEYFLYQTMVGVWPFEGANLDDAGHAEVAERLKAYMRKAMNEAKANTSWVNPNEPYQEAVAAFIEAVLRREDANRFLPDFFALQRRVAHYGALNSLSQVLLKLTGPGIPDIYQGNELWDLSLVDPDNRRLVDYALRRRLLKEVDRIKTPGKAAALLGSLHDGRSKLLVTSRALRYRSGARELFERGSYLPLQASGAHPECVVSFAREHEGRTAVVIAPCLMSRLGSAAEEILPVGQVWLGASLLLPGFEPGTRFKNVLTGESIRALDTPKGAAIALDEALAAFPVALLERQPDPRGGGA